MDNTKTVQMAVVNPGTSAADGDFTFTMQPRYNASRTVQYALVPSDAEALHKALTAYLTAQPK